MGEWTNVNLSELADITTRKGHSNGDVVCLNMDCVESGKVVSYADSSLTSDKLAFSAGDVLFAKLRPYLKKYWLAEFDGLCSSEFIVLRAKPRIRSQYLYYVVSSEVFVNYNNSQTYGSKMPRTSWEIAKKFKYRIPELPEQDLILSVLTAADEAIAASHALVEKYAAVKQGLMRDLLGKGERVRLGGEGGVGEVITSNVDKHVRPEEIPVRLCNYTDVYNNRYIVDDMPFMRGSVKPAELRRFTIHDGDVIITKDSETPNDIGMPAVICGDIEGLVCGYHLAIIRPKKGKYDGRFVMLALQTQEAVNYFSRMANGITRYGMTIKTIENQTIYAPQDIEEQRRISEIIFAADERLTAERERLKKLEDIKRGLMDDLLTNKVSTDKLRGGFGDA